MNLRIKFLLMILREDEQDKNEDSTRSQILNPKGSDQELIEFIYYDYNFMCTSIQISALEIMKVSEFIISQEDAGRAKILTNQKTIILNLIFVGTLGIIWHFKTFTFQDISENQKRNNFY